MKKIWVFLSAVFLLFSVTVTAGQPSRNDMEMANSDFEQWSKSLAEFVRDVRFNEDDIRSFISLADDFNAIGAEEDREAGEYVDFNSILNDSDYLAWTRKMGLNSETWLKKSMRIVAVMMRTEMEENMPAGQIDLQAQLEQLELMKDQMGEEAYQQAVQAMSGAAAAMRGLDDAYRNLPVPTEAEKALLVQYRDKLMSIE